MIPMGKWLWLWSRPTLFPNTSNQPAAAASQHHQSAGLSQLRDQKLSPPHQMRKTTADVGCEEMKLSPPQLKMREVGWERMEA